MNLNKELLDYEIGGIGDIKKYTLRFPFGAVPALVIYFKAFTDIYSPPRSTESRRSLSILLVSSSTRLKRFPSFGVLR